MRQAPDLFLGRCNTASNRSRVEDPSRLQLLSLCVFFLNTPPVLVASGSDDMVTMFLNDGASPPNFVARVITTGVDGASSVFSTDVDGNGLPDGTRQLSPGILSVFGITSSHMAVLVCFRAPTSGGLPLILATVLSAANVGDRIFMSLSSGGSPPAFSSRPLPVFLNGVKCVVTANMDGNNMIDSTSSLAVWSFRLVSEPQHEMPASLLCS